MRDFWLSCGHHLLDRDRNGRLRVTDEFMKLYLARPELVPPPDACGVERSLQAAFLADPWRPVAPVEIDAIADADARENWRYLIALRDQLAIHRTLEATYTTLVRENIQLPPIFVDQLTHLILRNALDRCQDGYALRAAELFFRPQRLTLHEGALLAADQEYVDASGRGASPLAAMLGLPEQPTSTWWWSPSTRCVTSCSRGMWGSTPTAPGSATRSGMASRSTRRRAAGSSGCSA